MGTHARAVDDIRERHRSENVIVRRASAFHSG